MHRGVAFAQLPGNGGVHCQVRKGSPSPGRGGKGGGMISVYSCAWTYDAWKTLKACVADGGGGVGVGGIWLRVVTPSGSQEVGEFAVTARRKNM